MAIHSKSDFWQTIGTDDALLIGCDVLAGTGRSAASRDDFSGSIDHGAICLRG